ncbi:hypothetical protein ACH4T9_03040 [Micromonospora sp. NPDC020750]|uniref:hypothetical protein n=1 Tax=unclassified Micromonospora TaxID=2617518 RepID=UPI0037927526
MPIVLGIGTFCDETGVAANSRIRALTRQRCAEAGIHLRVPSPRLCTDNGAMIAAVGDLLVRADVPPSPLQLGADSSAPLARALIGNTSSAGRPSPS